MLQGQLTSVVGVVLQVGRMRWPAPHLAPHPKGTRHLRGGSTSPTKAVDGPAAAKEPESASGGQVEEMRALLQVPRVPCSCQRHARPGCQ
jgi:hypothetical protein